MPNFITPTNQTQTINPYDSRVFDFNTVDARVYLSRTINSLLKAVGQDCILDGLTVTSATYSLTGDTITVTLSPGRVIIDETLVSFPSSTTLDIDVTDYQDTGHLIVGMGFTFLPTIYTNRASIKLLYVSQDGTQVLPGPWFTNFDRVVVAKLSFNKTSRTVTNDTTISFSEASYINILGTSMEIYPMDNFTTRVRTTIVPNVGFF